MPRPPGLRQARLRRVGAAAGGGPSTALRADANPFLTGNITLLSGPGVALAQVGQDITISAGGTAVNKITWAEDAQQQQTGVAEAVVANYNINFDDAGAVAVAVRFSAIIARLGAAGTATFRVYVGGTVSNAVVDGTLRATLSTLVGEAAATILGVAFANPGGQRIVKVTAQGSAVGVTARIRGKSFAIG